MRPKLRINVPPPSSAPPDTLSGWPPSDLEPSRERLQAWLELFLSLGKWHEVDECEGFLFETIADPAERHDALLRSGDRWWRQRNDAARARLRYRQALDVDPLSERANARLRAVAHELGRRRVQPFRPA